MSRFGETRFLISAAAPAQFPPDAGAEVAFAGRSNAGKSSAINAIAQRRALARTSKTPGRTRLLNFFELAPLKRLVDLPGYGYANVLSKADKLNHGEAAAVLRAAAATLGGRATAQLFSALEGTGVTQAQDTLAAWLACPIGKGQ
ncbi:MAG: hypothetical protein E6K50_04590 [Gammaproteobacteria bacterium]|nr:MAG: hypothetical protein E6K50_04590 [Gammaproteobacteria bacterium]